MKTKTLLLLVVTAIVALATFSFTNGMSATETTRGVQFKNNNVRAFNSSYSDRDVMANNNVNLKAKVEYNGTYTTSSLTSPVKATQSVKQEISKTSSNLQQIGSSKTYNVSSANPSNQGVELSNMNVNNAELFAQANNNSNAQMTTRAFDDPWAQPGNISSPLFLIVFLVPFVCYKFFAASK